MRERPFHDWLDEIENYGTRYERLLDEMQHMTPERMLQWLYSAYEIGKNANWDNWKPNKDIV